MRPLIGIFLFVLTAPAFAGIKEGGSGSFIESAFRIRARELVEAVARHPSADKLCPVEAMRTALTSPIRVVKELKDPSDRCKVNEETDACTYPGDFQLKFEPWDKMFSQPLTKVGSRGLDATILHEVYRASKGCDDDHYVITDQVYPLIESTPATFAAPNYEWRSCFSKIELRGKDGKMSTEEFSLEDTYVQWMDGNNRYLLDLREYKNPDGSPAGTLTQSLTSRVNGENPEVYQNAIKGSYFEANADGASKEDFESKYEVVMLAKNHYASIDRTHDDASKNLGKVVHTITPGPGGFQNRVEEQVEPDPAYADGNQRMSHKNLCSVRPMREEEVQSSAIFKFKKQIQDFSKMHVKAMLAKNLWQTCQESAPDTDCALPKKAFDRADAERLAVWNKLIRIKDVGSFYVQKKAASKTNRKPSNKTSGGDDSTCAKMQGAFKSCLALAKRYGSFCPMHDSYVTAHCVDVPYWYQRCTGHTGPWYCRPNYR